MLFDSTLRKDLGRSFGATVVVILTIVLTMLLIRTLSQAAGGVIAPQDVALLLGFVALGQLPTILALSLFIAVVATLGRMYRESEMAVWFASGVGLARFVRPVLGASWPVLVVIAVMLVFVWPWGNRQGLELRAQYEQRSDLSRLAPGVFQTSRDGKSVFFVERNREASAESRNVFVLTGDRTKETVTSARAGRLEAHGDDRVLVLEHGQRNETDAANGEKTLATFDIYRLIAWESDVKKAQELRPNARPTAELLRNPTPQNQAELALRLGLALGAVNMVLLGIGLAATNPRRASNWNLLFALLGFVIYFNLINLTQAWVLSGRVPLPAALLGLHGGAFALALALIWWRDHAAVFGQRRAGRTAGSAA